MHALSVSSNPTPPSIVLKEFEYSLSITIIDIEKLYDIDYLSVTMY